MLYRKLLSLLFSLCVLPLSAQHEPSVWSLHDCMEYAVQNSPRRKIQTVRNDDLRGMHTEAGLAFLPQVSGSSSAGFSFGRSIDPTTNTYTSGTTTKFSNNYGLSANLKIFNGFSVVNTLRVSRVAQLQGADQLQILDDEIALTCMQSYYNAIYAYGLVGLAREQLAESRNNLKNTLVQEELGLKGNSDVLQIEARVASDEFNLIQQENSLNNYLLQLKEAMFFPTNGELEIDTAATFLTVPLAPQESPDSIFRQAVDYLPWLRYTNAHVRQARINVNTARWQLAPAINASGGYSTGYFSTLSGGRGSATRFSEQFRNQAGEFFQVNMSIPIFAGWSRQSSLARKRNQVKIATHEHDQKMQEIEMAIARAVQDRTSAAKEYIQAALSVAAEQSAHQTNVRSYEEGLLSILDLETSANKLLRAKSTRLDALLRYQLTSRVVSYYKGTPYLHQEF